MLLLIKTKTLQGKINEDDFAILRKKAIYDIFVTFKFN